MSELSVFCGQLGIERRLDRRDARLPCSLMAPSRCSHSSPRQDGEQLTFPNAGGSLEKERIVAQYTKHMLALHFLGSATIEACAALSSRRRSSLMLDVNTRQPRAPEKLRELASWYRDLAERAGSTVIWEARLR